MKKILTVLFIIALIISLHGETFNANIEPLNKIIQKNIGNVYFTGYKLKNSEDIKKQLVKGIYLAEIINYIHLFVFHLKEKEDLSNKLYNNSKPVLINNLQFIPENKSMTLVSATLNGKEMPLDSAEEIYRELISNFNFYFTANNNAANISCKTSSGEDLVIYNLNDDSFNFVNNSEKYYFLYETFKIREMMERNFDEHKKYPNSFRATQKSGMLIFSYKPGKQITNLFWTNFDYRITVDNKYRYYTIELSKDGRWIIGYNSILDSISDDTSSWKQNIDQQLLHREARSLSDYINYYFWTNHGFPLTNATMHEYIKEIQLGENKITMDDRRRYFKYFTTRGLYLTYEDLFINYEYDPIGYTYSFFITDNKNNKVRIRPHYTRND